MAITLDQIPFELLTSRKIEQLKKWLLQNEQPIHSLTPCDPRSPRMFYVLSGCAEYSPFAAEEAARLDLEYKRIGCPSLQRFMECYINAGMANFAHFQNRDADVEKYWKWAQENSLRYGADKDVIATVHLAYARAMKRQSRRAEALNAVQQAILAYESANLPEMVAVSQVTEAWLLLHIGDFQGATQRWDAAYSRLERSEDWTLLGNILFSKARRKSHAGREEEAVDLMQKAIDFDLKCDPRHRNLSRIYIELAKLQIRMVAGESNPTRAIEWRQKADHNRAQAEKILQLNPNDHRNKGRLLLFDVNRALYGGHHSVKNARELANKARTFAENCNDPLLTARSQFKQAVVEYVAVTAARNGHADQNSPLLHALRFANEAANTASQFENDRLSARIHTLLGNLFLERPICDPYRADEECDDAVRAMEKHQDDDYVVQEIRQLEKRLQAAMLAHPEPSRPIYLVTGSQVFTYSLEDIINDVEQAIVQAAVEALGSAASAYRIEDLLKIGHEKIDKHCSAKKRRFPVDEPADGDRVIFRVTKTLALSQPLNKTVHAVEHAIVRAVCMACGCNPTKICRILRAGNDRVGKHLPEIVTEFEGAGLLVKK